MEGLNDQFLPVVSLYAFDSHRVHMFANVSLSHGGRTALFQVKADLGSGKASNGFVLSSQAADITSSHTDARRYFNPAVNAERLRSLFTMSSLAARSVSRCVSRSVQTGRSPLRNSAVLAQKSFRQQTVPSQQVQPLVASRPFSTTMSSLASSLASGHRDQDVNAFDQEILDMAEYIHKYKIDSDLAVS